MTSPAGMPVCLAMSGHSIPRIRSARTCSRRGSYPFPSDTHSSGISAPRKLPDPNSSLMTATALPRPVCAGMTAIGSGSVCLPAGKELRPAHRTHLQLRRSPMLRLWMLAPPGIAAFGGAELPWSSGRISRHRLAALRAEPLHHVREDVLQLGVEALCAIEALRAVIAPGADHSRPCSAGVMFHRSLCFVHPSFTSLIAQRNAAIFQENQRKRRKKEGTVFGAPPAGSISRRPLAALA